MLKTTVTGAGNAKSEIEKALKDFITDKFVTIGIHEDAGMHQNDGITNAQLGAVLNFGNDKLEAREWLAPGVEVGNQEYLQIITDGIENHEPLEKSLEMVGNVAVGRVKQYMIDLKTPPNKQSTINKKGSSNPLIDTSALMQSVTYNVTSTKPEEGL